jgi:nicotinamide mononucleotide transporter
MSLLDWLVALLGIANIVLIVRRSIWNFPVALVMVSIFGVRLAQERLYSDAGLQVFFFAMNIYGWWAWTRNKGETGTLVVERLSTAARWSWVAGTALITALWGTAMANLTNADYPYWDGAIAMISVAAQILMTRRYLENWHGWILVNILSVPLYFIKGLYPPAGLYVVNLVIAIAGLIEWQKVRKAATS